MEKKLMGERITTAGAVMIALSVVLPIVGLRGPMLNLVLGVLGLVGVDGHFQVRGVSFNRGGAERTLPSCERLRGR